MNHNLNFGLKGQYKVDLYSGKKLVETTDWFSNDITNWGLNYPFDYSFARCFMFLSLGSTFGTDNKASTGLTDPKILKFRVKSSNGVITEQSGQYIGWQGYEVGRDKNATSSSPGISTCGTIFNKRGMSMYRGWTIPTGNSDKANVLDESLNIKQLMLSPSSGLDSKGNKAFSLVNRDITIPSGYSATITYQLSIELDNYSNPYTFFSGKKEENTNGFFETGKAYAGKNNSELPLLSGWSNFSGIFRQITPGFEIVDQFGACVRPSKMGNELEPYVVNCFNTFFYLSPDISHFCLSKYGKYRNQNEAYNSIGLLANYPELATFNEKDLDIKSDQTQAIYGKEDINKWFYSGINGAVGESVYEAQSLGEITIFPDLRLEDLISIENYKTGILNFSYKTLGYTGAINYPLAYATPGKVQLNPNIEDFGQKFVRSTFLKRMPIDPSVKNTSTRFKYVTKKAIIPPLYCYGTNSRYGSLTLAYANATPSNLTDVSALNVSPYIDFLFFDTEGRGSNMAHYRYIPTIYLKDRGTGVAKIRFDILGVDQQKPNSINRFYSAYGFMGSGVNTATNESGLDVNHSYLNGIITDSKSNFIPIGDKTSGFLLPGQILNENVSGNINQNNKTGYGAVYGIIANSGFYTSPYDVCLLDIPNWSGLGGNPSETLYLGYTGSINFSGNLCWPHYSKKIYLKTSQMQYFDPQITGTVIDDPSDFFANNQIIKNILVPKDGVPNKFNLTGFPGGVFVLNSQGKNINQSIFKNANNNGILRVKDNDDNYFNYNFQIVFQNNPLINKISTTGTNSIEDRGFNKKLPFTIVGVSGILSNNDTISGIQLSGYSNSSFFPIDEYNIELSNFKKPEAFIYHVETTGNDIGYRLLPNYAIANTGNINKYSPVTGGTFPGLSTENGLELFLTLTWSGL